MRVGIFLPNWIGDVVMATPTLRALRQYFGPAAHVVGIMRPYVADVLAGNEWLDETVLYAKSGGQPEHSTRSAIRNLRAAQLDQILLLTNSTRTAWIAWRSGARSRVGFGGIGRRLWLTRTVRQPVNRGTGRPLPTVDSYLYLASALGCPPEPPRLELATLPIDEQAADAAWRRLGLPPGNEVVVFNTGGAFGEAKNWPSEHFAALAARIVADWGCSVLVNCGPAERDAAQEIVARVADARVVSLAGEPKLPLGLSKACIRRARLLITTDSGPRFFGIAFGRPVVTIFGPTSAQHTETHYEREMCLSLALDCRPCMERTCPLSHHRCMRDLSADFVYRAVCRQLAEGPSERAA
jgi:heptosyltransferase-2